MVYDTNVLNDQTQSKLFKKAKFAVFLLQFTPFIRMVALSGSLARSEAHENSDIDFIIITQKNRIWTCRAISMLIMALFGLKRYPDKIKGRVCLNLYQTQNHLTLTTRNKILARSHAYSIPLWEKSDIFSRFVKANVWIKDYGKSFLFSDYKSADWEKFISFIISIFRILNEFLFDLFFADWGEKVLKNYQTKRIKKDQRIKFSKVGEIYLSDNELRFHPEKISKS